MSEARGLAGVRLQTEYRTGEDDLVAGFYRPCLARATTYDRGAGFFRSTVLLLIGPMLIDFAKRGGKIRIVCSPDLSAEDITALDRGYDLRAQVVAKNLDRTIGDLLNDPSTRERTIALATLVGVGALDIAIALRPPRYGQYHEKLGIFTDAYGQAVSFRGSSNETWHGWGEEGNLESFEVFASWRGGMEADRVARHARYFDRLWTGRVPYTDVLPFPDAPRARLRAVAASTLQELELPSAPLKLPRTPQPHQLNALEKWAAQGRRGILEHATGSGKTFTALLALREHVSPGDVGLVLVPSQLLLGQWELELRRELPGATLLVAGGGHNKWRDGVRLAAFTNPDRTLGPRVVLATMQTACKEEFLRHLTGGPHVLVVMDEVHQAGSPSNRSLLRYQAGARLGLSATPTRFGDPEGTAALLDYFGSIIQPPFTLRDAIRAGRLVPYQYFPQLVHLSDDEAGAWKNLTMQLRREVARSSSRDTSSPLSEHAKMLAIQRSRIAKKATGKVGLAARILTEYVKEYDRWLVYCEDLDQLAAVRAELGHRGVASTEYHSAMTGDRHETLRWFTEFGGVLLSVRCLDEGVDIPEVTHALILASSQNPRQFIQRRGRVLRATATKAAATVYDALVLPPTLADEPEQLALARAELARAIQFADDALNPTAAIDLRDWAIHAGIDVTLTAAIGDEPEDEDA